MGPVINLDSGSDEPPVSRDGRAVLRALPWSWVIDDHESSPGSRSLMEPGVLIVVTDQHASLDTMETALRQAMKHAGRKT